MGPEAAMGQHAMVADGQAEGIERVHRYQQCQVGPSDGLLPKQRDCQNSSEERNGHNYKNKRFGVAQRFHKISTGVVASAKSRDMLGKGGAGVLPCRGSRGVPLVSPFPKKVRRKCTSFHGLERKTSTVSQAVGWPGCSFI